MIAVAIVEDEESASKQLTEYINRYGKEQGEQFQVSLFANVGSFLEPYKKVDIVFMDIIMPGLNGMDGARQLREIDPETKLVFVTNMAQYAVQGYEVDALDFVVKPVNYKDFSYKMNRVVKAVKNHRRNLLSIEIPGGIQRVCVQDILYVEVEQHTVIYHTTDGEYRVRGTMKNVEQNLQKWHFLRCNNCYLINPRHMEWVRGYELKIGEDVLQISHPRKKKFLEELADYYSMGEAE